jgi:formylglycine-generating enzyme required for sulfatase activity
MSRFAVKIIFLFFLAYLPSALFAICPRAWGENRDRDLGLEAVSHLEKESGVQVGTYRALVIGINDYQDPGIPKLKTAVNDARELADVLKQSYGFKSVTLLLDADANASRIIKEFRDLTGHAGEGDSVLIYYSGHGDIERDTGGGWWAPWNAKAGDPSTYIDNEVIQKYIKKIPGRHVFLVSDSCFSGTLFGETKALPPVIDDKFYGSLYKEKSRWGMTSGNLTPVEDFGANGHSIFAWQFLKTLKENNNSFLTPREIFAKVGPIVRNNSQQMPVCKPIRDAGDAGGEFVFIRTASLGPVSPLPPPQPVIPSPKKELLYAALKIGTNPSGAEIFIDGKRVGDTQGGYLVWEKYPVGEYSVKAQKKGYYEKEAMLRLRKEGETLIIDMDPSTPPPAPAAPAPVAPKPGPAPEGMVFVKGGCFKMGDTFGDGEADEKPVHEVCVNDFYMDKYEVTVGEFREFVSNSGYKADAETTGGCYKWIEKWEIDKNTYWDSPGYAQTDSNPVSCVSWNDAQEYLKWKSRKAGKTVRLPTEAEWEYAASYAGGPGKKSRFGTGKDTIGPDEANFNASADYKKPYSRTGEYREKTLPVGSFDPNALGLYDMSGNVWEWVSDWYDENYYRSSPKDNPQGPSSGEYRVLRGGSWDLSPSYLRAANRLRFRPAERYNGLGFRCVRPVR